MSSSSSSSWDYYSSSSSESLDTEHTSVRLKTSYGIDRISALPDAILHHILGFMDMKDVVKKTSLLSKRWGPLWKSTPTLNFGSSEPYFGSSYKQFVERVLLLRSDYDIQKLRLHCCRSASADLHVWMAAAVKRHVQELHLIDYSSYSSNFSDKFPELVFTSAIKILYLSCDAKTTQLPNSMCLAPQLHTLDIASARLPSAAAGDSDGQLILCCPVLNSLSIRNCDCKLLKILNISAPQLKKLELENVQGESDYVQGESYCINSCAVKISTPKLISLVFKGRLYRDYCLENLSSLVSAKFQASEPVPPQILIKLLNGCYNATTLELSGQFLEASEESVDMLDQPLTSFFSLTDLNLMGWSGDSSIPTITNLIENSPFIQTLSFRIDQIGKRRYLAELYQCIYRLKSIEIDDIEGTEDELKHFAFVLKTAIVLEDFTVTSCESHGWTRKELAKFNMKIHALPRASSKLKILFLSK